MNIQGLKDEADKKPIRVKHMTNPGDVIASLAGLKSFREKTERKVIFCQQIDVEANYYPNATHETKNATGLMVCMNSKMWEMITPLLLSQEYIHSVEEYNGQEILIDIDVIRKKTFVNLPHGQIQSWIFYAYPDIATDLSKSWIALPEQENNNFDYLKDKILLNFTERYRNGYINYYFLRKFKDRLLFAGTAREHLLFINKWKIEMPLLIVNDFLELAYAIKNCKFLLSNQSMCWNIAEAMKTPRILEICEFAVNCIPFIGEKSYGFYHQEALEHYVNLLT